VPESALCRHRMHVSYDATHMYKIVPVFPNAGSGSAFPMQIWIQPTKIMWIRIQPTKIMRADPDLQHRVKVNFVNHAYPLESLITFSVGNRSSPRCSGMTGMTTFSRLSSSSPPSITRGSRNGFCRISNGWITGDV
jgi:hypothetical protein